MNCTTFLLPCFLLVTTCAQAQMQALYENKPGIDAKTLAGVWVSADTFHAKIEFTDTGYDMTLQSVPPGFLYYFMKDSTGIVSASGYYPQWPPPGCELQLLADDTLKVSHSQYGATHTVQKYVKE